MWCGVSGRITRPLLGISQLLCVAQRSTDQLNQSFPLYSSNAIAWTPYSKPVWLNYNGSFDGGGIFIILEDNDPNYASYGCTYTENRFMLPSSTPGFKEMYGMLLMAYTSGNEVALNISGCSSSGFFPKVDYIKTAVPEFQD